MAGRSLRTADAFPVVASLPPKNSVRERSDDRKCVCCSQAMGDAVLEDFRGKGCAFVANWLRGKGLNKLCGVFEVFKF